jgi:predicted nucleotidyltransferase
MDPKRLEDVARRHGILLLLQFGSTVDGRERPDSDLDLAVLLASVPATLPDLGTLATDLQALSPDRKVDVAQGLRGAPDRHSRHPGISAPGQRLSRQPAMASVRPKADTLYGYRVSKPGYLCNSPLTTRANSRAWISSTRR